MFSKEEATAQMAHCTLTLFLAFPGIKHFQVSFESTLSLSFSTQCCSLNLCASTGHSKSKTRNPSFLEWGSLKVRGKAMGQILLILSEIISRSLRVSDRVTMILPRGCWLQELLNLIWSLFINSSIYLFIYSFKKYVSCKYDVQNPVIDAKEK